MTRKENLDKGYTRIYLKINANDIDFDMIDNELELSRDLESSSKNGSPLQYINGMSKFDSWNSKSIYTTDQDIETHINDLLDKLLVKQNIIEKIIKYFDATIFLEVVPYIDPGEYLPCLSMGLETRSKLLKLNIILDLDYYII